MRTPKSRMFRQYRNILPPRSYMVDEHNLALATAMMGLEAFEEYMDFVLTHFEGARRDEHWKALSASLEQFKKDYDWAEYDAYIASLDA